MSSHPSEPLSDRGPDHAVAARVEQLYESHAGLVRSVCRSLLRDRVEAEDAVQQTFLSAQRALANGSSPRDTAAWLATIARNESLARVRSRMREPLPLETEAVGAGPDAHTTAVRREEMGGLREALASLPVQQRDAILLREVRGFSYEEVAATLSVTTPAVESLLFRARRTLQLRLREALATVSPGQWAQPLRDLLANLVGGGLALPTAAKVAAVGMGTAVVAGGAVVEPTVIGLGHAPAPARHSAPPRTQTAPSAVSVDPAAVWTRPPRQPVRVVVHRTSAGGDGSHRELASRTEASDAAPSSTSSRREHSDSGSGGGASEKSPAATSGSTSESGGGSTREMAASGGDGTASGSSGDGSASGSGGGSASGSSGDGSASGSGGGSTDSGSRDLGD